MNFYQRLVNKFCKETFGFWQALGVHLTPVHFYSPIPDTRGLTDAFFRQQSELVGLDMNEVGQVNFLSTVAKKYQKEYNSLAQTKPADTKTYYVHNGSFESVDGEMLYTMIRHFKPKRVWEIGSGWSTLLAAQAMEKNRAEGLAGELVAFEPYPKKFLKQNISGLTRLVEKKIQDVPAAEFAKLGAGDILFIDSSHVLKAGSDVQYEYLEILPRLQRGVVIHIHDIFLPMANYPKDWLARERWFWNEQYLAQAFLAFNSSFEILWAGSLMHWRHPDLLKKFFASYNSKNSWRPGSLWLEKK